MIFTGDVAIADGDSFDFVGFPNDLYRKPMCINFEGAIKRQNDSSNKSGVVYNSETGIEKLFGFDLAVTFLANNHIHDIEGGVGKTCRFFKEKGMGVIGAGNSLSEAERPGFIDSGGFRYAVLGFGWPVIGCIPCGKNSPGVNEFNRISVIDSVEKIFKIDKISRVVVVIHGNYEFEPYPQPGHRKLALELIDLGVYAVIFHHPHIVGPVERYKGKTIAYSLGNFAFSYGKFFDGKLVFPERSFHQVLIELGNEDTVHHCYFKPPSQVLYNNQESVHSDEFSLKAEFEGFSDSEYLMWFRENRHKSIILPVYKSADKSYVNYLKDSFVYLRQKLIAIFVRLHIKGVERK